MNVKTSILLAILLGISSVFAQKKDENYNYRKVDSVKMYIPIGNISTRDDHAIVPNEFLTSDFSSKSKVAIQANAPFNIQYIDNQNLQDLENQKYFSGLMRRLEKIDLNIFSKSKIGDKIKAIIAPEEGRYFGFIFYSGFDHKADPTIVSSTEKLIVVAEDSKGLSLPLATEQPFVKTYVIVVDKKSDKIIYFNQVASGIAPSKQESSENLGKKLFADFK